MSDTPTTDIEKRIVAVREANVATFSALARRWGATSAGVGYSDRSQAKRFEIISKVGDLQGKTVLDVGCGFGGFYDFLQKKGVGLDYTGFDITPAMVEMARKRWPLLSDRFIECDILVDDPKSQYDFVVSNGPLNLRFENNLEIMVRLIERMLKLSRIGMVITMTSALTKKPAESTYYYDPSEILRRVNAFCPNALVDHTYLPHDFAIFCYKRSLYD